MADESPEPQVNQPDSAESARAEAAAASAESMAQDALKQTEAAADKLTDAAVSSMAEGPLNLPEFGADGQGGNAEGIGLLNDVELGVKIELGRTVMYVEDVLRLDDGSIIELDKAAGDPVDIYVNGRHIARGEVLVLNDNFCVRISEIVAARPGEPPLTAVPTEEVEPEPLAAGEP